MNDRRDKEREKRDDKEDDVVALCPMLHLEISEQCGHLNMPRECRHQPSLRGWLNNNDNDNYLHSYNRHTGTETHKHSQSPADKRGHSEINREKLTDTATQTPRDQHKYTCIPYKHSHSEENRPLYAYCTQYQKHYANDADELERYGLFKKSKASVAKGVGKAFVAPTAVMGPNVEMGDVQSAIHLNRLLRLYPPGAEGGERWELEADPRHVEISGITDGIEQGKQSCEFFWCTND